MTSDGSSGGGVVRALLRSVLDGLSRPRRRDLGRREDAGATTRRPAALRSRTRRATAVRPGPIEVLDEDTPGRSGAGATRDLSAGEIRALRPAYRPQPDGDPDPGEIVWTWVPYAEHDGRGKDRPVLIIARIDARTTAGCYLSTKQHGGFVSVGTGAWDSQGRESYLSPERVLRISDSGMRREGHVLSPERFARAVAVVVERHGMRP